MPYILGISLNTIVALFFAVHAFRTNQGTHWFYILFGFPGLGIAAYFFAVYIDEIRGTVAVHQATNKVKKLLDPQKELREAQKQYNYSPTTENHYRLAEAFLDVGQPLDAAETYLSCFNDPLADTVKLSLSTAKAYFEAGKFHESLKQLQMVTPEEAGTQAEYYAVLAAKCYSAMQNYSQAETIFLHAIAEYHTVSVNIEYLIWGYQQNRLDIIQSQEVKVEKMMSNWTKHHYKHLDNKAIIKRLKTIRAEFNKKQG